MTAKSIVVGLAAATLFTIAQGPNAQTAAAPGKSAPAASASATSGAMADPAIERGRYLTQISGCNDCHTPGYAEKGGRIPESEWLTGVSVGFQGPWGTAYPSNLRLVAQQLAEDQFIARARSMQLRPPMPWFNVVAMKDDDVRAIYRFTRSLGAKGTATPAPTPPGIPVATPYILFVPQNLPGAPKAK